MDLEIMSFIAAVGTILRLFWLRLNYTKHEAICLDYTVGRGGITKPLYEYQLLEGDKIITYQNWGSNYFSPRRGKRYKVLINKKNPNKVLGVNVYLANIIRLIVFVCILV